MEKPPQNNFLAEKYNDLNTSKEVERAISEKEKVEKVPQKKDARIGAYMERLEKVIYRDPEGKGDLTGGERLESMIMKDFVLDIKDEVVLAKLARSLYESEKKIAIERGQTNQVQELEAKDSELLEKYKKSIIEKHEIQKETLNSWFNYFNANDAEYPIWFRYFVFRSLKTMGQFNRDNATYAKRTQDTIAPFPEMNAEALAFVYTAINKQLEIEEIPKDGRDKKEIQTEKDRIKKEYLKDIPLDDTRREQLEQELLKRLEGKDFAKIYAFAQVEAAGSMSRESLKGEWIKYPKDSNYRILEKGLKGKGTGWCTAEGSAKGQLEQGDFYVYYTLNKQGEPTEPRIAIRMANDSVAEIRGVNPRQELEPELVETAKEKYKDLPGAEKYEKADKDMRTMTSIYNKAFKVNPETKEKIYLNPNLSREELVFLYEINSTIQSFGYDKDPRVKELRDKREVLQDAPVVFGCKLEEIAFDLEDINENTKAYIGEWNPKVFNHLPKNITHLYEEFPNKKILRRELELNPKTGEQYKNEIVTGGMQIYSEAEFMLNKMKTLDKKEKLNVVSFSVEQLGFPNGATLQQIYDKAKELGLELCPPQVGPELRLAYRDQPSDEYLRVAMDSINDSDGLPRLFYVLRHDDGGEWLYGNHGHLDDEWLPHDRFVFVSRKS